MQKEIKVPIIRTLLYIFTTLFIGALLWLAINNDWFKTPKEKEIEKTAYYVESSVQAFYTIDYRTSPDTWANNLCKFTTQNGCTYAKDFYLKFFWPAIEENKVRTDVTVIDSKIIYMQPDMQVWKVLIEPGEIWIGLNDNHNEINEIYVELQKDADSQWKMDHILTDIEHESLLKEVDVE